MSTFTNTEMNTLVHLIVDGVMNRYESISSNLASEISDNLIVQFTSETKGVYFYPARSNFKNSVC